MFDFFFGGYLPNFHFGDGFGQLILVLFFGFLIFFDRLFVLKNNYLLFNCSEHRNGLVNLDCEKVFDCLSSVALLFYLEPVFIPFFN